MLIILQEYKNLLLEVFRMNKDLEGIQVITLEQAVAAPYASGKLAQAGARVIKIE